MCLLSLRSQTKFSAVNVERRRWDLQEYERKAQQEARANADPSQLPPPRPTPTRTVSPHDSVSPPLVPLSCVIHSDTALIATAPLRNRTATPLSLTATLGKSQVVTATTPLAQRGGYYCDVCLCLLKDSQTYLDHINGRKHQKKQGITMKVERVGVDAVKEKLQQHTVGLAAQQRLGGQVRKRHRGEGREGEEDGEDGDERERGEGEDEGAAAEDEGESKANAIAAELSRTEEDAEEAAMMAAMGFKGFTAGNKSS